MKKLTKTFVLLLALLMACCAYVACEKAPAVTIDISKTALEVEIGETKSLTALASDGSAITWTTSDPAVATVNEKGKVTGVKEGTATITATSGVASATCTVTVVAPVTVAMEQTTATVEKGQTVTLNATASDGSTIAWSSSNPEIATVEGGVVTGLKEGTATITAAAGNDSKNCEVTVVWTDKPADYYEIVFSGEADAAKDPGKWYFWNDQGWCGSNVTATGEYVNGAASFTWSGNGAVWFGFQIFYDNAELTIGKQYELSLNINAENACSITVNGNVVALNAGDNQVKVYYTEAEKNVNNETACSISIQAGVNGGDIVDAGTLKISSPIWAEYAPEKLATPTAMTIGENKAINVTDTNGAKADAFKVSFLQAGVVKYEMTLANGAIIDDSTMEDGVYDVTVSAVGHGKYVTSDPSAVITTYTVANGGVKYDLIAGGESDAIANPGKWYFWTEFGGITNATYDNGTVAFEVVNGGNWYSNQIFYKNSSLTQGTQYKLTFKLISDVTEQITVNGNVITPVVGENLVELTYTESGSASFSMQAGIYGDGTVSIAAASFTISDIVWTAVGGENPPVDPDAPAIKNGDEGAALAAPGTYVYWNDQNWCGSNVQVNTAALENGVVTLAWETTSGSCFYGMQFFYKNADNVAGKTYKLTLKINSSVAGNITVNGKIITLVQGDNLIEVEYVEGATADQTCSLDIQMGDGGANTMVSAATLVISDVAWADATPAKTWSFAKAEIQNAAGVANLVLYLDYAGYDRAEIEALNWLFDLQENPYAVNGDWGGDWAYWFADQKPVIGFNETQAILTYNVTSLKAFKYTMHFGLGEGNAPDLKPAVGFETAPIEIGDKIYQLSCTAGSGDGAQFWGCIGVIVTNSATKTYTFASAEIQNAAGVANIVMHFTYTGYTRAEIEALSWLFDLQANANINGDDDWTRYLADAKPVVGFDDNGFILTYDITALNPASYTMHMGAGTEGNAPDLKASQSFKTEVVTVGEKTYQAVCYAGSSSGTEFWGCIGVIVKKVGQPEAAITGVELLQDGDKVYYIVTGTYLNLTAEDLAKMYIDLEIDKVDYAQGNLTITGENGIFQIKVDVTNFAAGQYWPHFFDYAGNKTDVKVEASQTVTVGGKTYTFEMAWSMPTLRVTVAA